jgi:hypothetical protein
VGATGFEPVTSSVSEIFGGSRRPAAGGGVRPVTSADGGPVLTGVVRCGPVVCGPDVAPGLVRSRPVADASGAPLLRDQVAGTVGPMQVSRSLAATGF